MWSKKNEQYTRPCYECGKDILAGEERYVWDTGDIVSRFFHLYCDKKYKEHQLFAKEKAEKLTTELRQLWDDLEPKVKVADLDAEETKKIFTLKENVSKFLAENEKVDIDSDHYVWIKISVEIFQKALGELDNFLKKYASPQTRDKAEGERKGYRECFHEKVIPHDDDSTWFQCEYCWEQNDKRFLNNLRWFYRKNVIDKWINKHNLSSREAINITNKLYITDYSNQTELKKVYEAVVKELNELAKSKGIPPIDNNSERERESKYRIELES